jgi:hypothetical protein
MRDLIITQLQAKDEILDERVSERKKAENHNHLLDVATRTLRLRPANVRLSFTDQATAPHSCCRYPIIETAPRRKVVWVWICCVCGYGGMKVSVDPCPNCCNPRCPNCDTRRINTRSHKYFNFQRGSWSLENIEVETGPASDLDLLLPCEDGQKARAHTEPCRS